MIFFHLYASSGRAALTQDQEPEWYVQSYKDESQKLSLADFKAELIEE